jgi:hypothetical protein
MTDERKQAQDLPEAEQSRQQNKTKDEDEDDACSLS